MGVTMEIRGSRGDLGTLVHGDCHPLLRRLEGLGDLDLFLMGPRHASDAHNKRTLFSRSEAFTNQNRYSYKITCTISAGYLGWMQLGIGC